MRIRRKVLNMPYDMWRRLDSFYDLYNSKNDDDSFETTPNEFITNIGLPGVLSAYCNDEENEFFEQIYNIARKEKS